MVEALRDRMKYLRGTSGRACAKTKSTSSTSQTFKKSKCASPPKFFPESPPIEIDEGEDKVSHDRHLKVLRSECQKINSNAEVKKKLMERTYMIRRSEILTNPKPVKILLNMYPPLKEYNEVITEITCKTELICIHFFVRSREKWIESFIKT